ncbi:phosphopantothenate--cysteine ligase (ATP) [Malassezia yamatoensis]|uniref:Phosphopantothenate--cysteine ligase (ATP) n=1 Tax=Malassezia yamatoensis TaxID=253288 RepID=A0AAJ6CGL6_9BASI|nr:phosphopantothenate--cysteine ligase (ATP) [Malassezia yamatoensis]
MSMSTSGWTSERFYAEYETPAVRFVDNFSAGTRGAASAEYFLAAGYAVIFLSRQHSQFPYTRLYSHTTNPFFDILQEPQSASGDGQVRVKDDQVEKLLPVLHAYHQAIQTQCLLSVPFVTVIEYLFLLRGISEEMKPLHKNAMHYLAAAVSDFFIPLNRIQEHKIQSSDGGLQLVLEPVPKVLANLVHDWTPESYVVSFKLETDQQLIIPKAEISLDRYGHQLVIGNDLARRKTELVFIERVPENERKAGAKAYKSTEFHLSKEATYEIEQDVVASLNDRHSRWIEGPHSNSLCIK